MAITTQTDAIEACIKGAVEADGLAIVQVRMTDGKKRKTLQIFLECQDGSGVNVDQISRASRAISALLDVEDIISGEYNLEVSSPGIDRPLKTQADFERYAGFEAKLETTMPINGRRRYAGPITAVGEDTVSIKVDGEVHEVPISLIGNAKLKLTDELIKSEQARRKAHTH